MRRWIVFALLVAIGFPSILIRVPRPAAICARHECGCHGTTPSESCCCGPVTDPGKVRWGCSPVSGADSIARVREWAALPRVTHEPTCESVRAFVAPPAPLDPGPRFAPPVPPPRARSGIASV